jgi:DNA (cytosine-5)-methyltransferase 1
MLKLLDLFSGIGGFSLGLESTGGFETIAFVEKDDFCQKVLKKHWPNTTIEGDIRNVKGDKYEADIITGGFPCQPFSVAGKRKGTDDDRYLWDETIRVVRECKPRWFIGENVEGLININNGLVLRQVQTDLEKEGFEVQCLVIPASGIGAWHQRKRIWIVGYANNNGYSSTKIKRSNNQTHDNSKKRENQTRKFERTIRSSDNGNVRMDVPNSNTRFSIGKNEEIQTRRTSINNGSEDVSNSKSINSNDGKYGNDSKEKQIQLKAGRKNSNGNVSNSNNERLQGLNSKSILREQELGLSTNKNDEGRETWWQTQSRICGVPNGVSFELDKDRNNRIKSLGNSIVPQIVRQLGFAILEAEK